MTSVLEHFFSTVFGNNVVLATILIAIVPIIELKGAIPFSMSEEIWGTFALNSWQAFLFSFIGSSLIVPVLALIYMPIIRWLKNTKLFRSIGNAIENKVNRKKDKVENKHSKTSIAIKVLSVFLFVAIPLPFTGVWTGTCLAVVLGLGFWLTCFTVILGNVVAGIIVTLFSSIVSPIVFLYIFLGLIAVGIVFFTIRTMISKKITKQNDLQDNSCIQDKEGEEAE